jgi:hypothetical protein
MRMLKRPAKTGSVIHYAAVEEERVYSGADV